MADRPIDIAETRENNEDEDGDGERRKKNEIKELKMKE